MRAAWRLQVSHRRRAAQPCGAVALHADWQAARDTQPARRQNARLWERS
jgi:hypothetical protein